MVRHNGVVAEGLGLGTALAELGFVQRCTLRRGAPEVYAAARVTAYAARETATRSQPSWFTAPATRLTAGLRR